MTLWMLTLELSLLRLTVPSCVHNCAMGSLTLPSAWAVRTLCIWNDGCHLRGI